MPCCNSYKQGRTAQGLESSDHEMAVFKILRGGITILKFRRVVFGLLRDLLGRIPLKTVLERRKVQGELAHLLQAQEESFPINSKSSKDGRRPSWSNNLLLTEKEVYKRWKEGKVTQKE